MFCRSIDIQFLSCLDFCFVCPFFSLLPYKSLARRWLPGKRPPGNTLDNQCRRNFDSFVGRQTFKETRESGNEKNFSLRSDRDSSFAFMSVLTLKCMEENPTWDPKKRERTSAHRSNPCLILPWYRSVFVVLEDFDASDIRLQRMLWTWTVCFPEKKEGREMNMVQSFVAQHETRGHTNFVKNSQATLEGGGGGSIRHSKKSIWTEGPKAFQAPSFFLFSFIL